jgi:hypothetical protein
MAAVGSASAQSRPAADEIPADQRPPKGMCRIWLKNVPAKQQPAPTDCAAAVKNCPPTGRVIFGDTEESKSKPKPEPSEVKDPKKATSNSIPVKSLVPKKPPV